MVFDRNRSGRFFAPVKQDEELDVKIEAVGEKGDGIARKQGFVLFVPNTKEGYEVRVRVTRVLKKVGFAEVVGSATGPVESDIPQAPKEEEEVPYDPSKESEDFGEEPAEEVAEAPVEEVAEAPVEEVAEEAAEPVEEVAEEPAEEVVEEPAKEVAEKPAEPVEEVAEEPAEEPAEEVAEEPAEEVAEKPADKVSEKK